MQSGRSDLHRLVDSLPDGALSPARRALSELQGAEESAVAAAQPFISHAALWVADLDRARHFYQRWFHAESGPLYTSATRPFRSHFLSLEVGPRLEIMTAPAEAARPAHVAVSLGSRGAVDELASRMGSAGVPVASGPRYTGEGYYEAVILDSEGIPLEITI